MERLTMRITGGKSVCEASEHCDNTCDKCLHLDRMIKKLANYEDAEEQGLLLRLPCKVGDTVWQIHTTSKSNRKIVVKVVADAFFIALCVLEGRFGKTVFLTREEAESALAEKGGAE